MQDLQSDKNHILQVSTFEELISSSFEGTTNAICWKRNLQGNFSELIGQLELNENIREIEIEELLDLRLNKAGELARETLIKDFNLLKNYGADPVINLIKNYERDISFPFFPTDVYSFHVDRSPIPSATFLCTYYGSPSEIVANSDTIQKILIPEIREKLKELHGIEEKGFEAFLTENFFDLHYQALSKARPISLGIGHIWKLAIDHPESKVLPCIHRAPEEKNGQKRLLLIC